MFPSQKAPCLGDGQALPGPCPDQAGFEFSGHGQDIEEEPAHGIGRFMDGTGVAELDFAAGEFVGNVLRIAQRPRQAVEFDHDQRFPGPAGGNAPLSPGHARLAPVTPWPVNTFFGVTSRASSAFFYAVRPWSLVDTQAYPMNSLVMVFECTGQPASLGILRAGLTGIKRLRNHADF